jgi:hypothetical protein
MDHSITRRKQSRFRLKYTLIHFQTSNPKFCNYLNEGDAEAFRGRHTVSRPLIRAESSDTPSRGLFFLLLQGTNIRLQGLDNVFVVENDIMR